MKKLLLTFILILSMVGLFAQKQGSELIDSIKISINRCGQDTIKVSLLGKLAFQYYKFDTDSGIYYARQAITLAESLKWGKGIAFSWNYLGTNYAVKGDFPKALGCFQKSLSKYTELDDKQGIAFLSNNLGNFYRIQKNYVLAEEYITKAILINSSIKNNIDLIKNYDNLGNVFFSLAQYRKSDSCYQKALGIAKEIGNKDLEALILINLSENKIKTGDFCGALQVGLEAIRISEELNIPYDGAQYNEYVGEIYFRITSDTVKIRENCKYYASSKPENLKSALKYLTKSVDLQKRINDLSLLSETTLLLSQVYEKMGDTGNALKYYKLYSASKDSVFSSDHSIKLANLEKIREVDLRDEKIKIQNLEIAHKNSQIWYQIILFLLMLMVISFILYSYYKTKMAKNLTASEERYRSIFENLQDIFYRIDPNGIILDISPSVERFSDYKRDELLGKPVFDYYTNPDDREKFINAIFEKGELRDWELKIRTKSGEKYVSVNAQLICDRNRTPIHVNGAMRDITERKRFEADLKESREKYHKDLVILNSIFESPVNIIMFALDQNYCYTAFTRFHKKTMKAIWGVDIGIGMNMLELISNEQDRKKAKSNFDRALAGEYFIETEEYGDNSLLRTFYENYYSSVKIADGTIVGVSVFVIDVTHRKKAEKQLELLIKAIEQSPVTVIITDKIGNIEYVNPHFTAVSGYSFDEVIGQNPRILHSDGQSKEFYNDLWNTILSGRKWIGEFRNKKKNGDFYDESAIISPIVNPDGRISHFVAVKTDITEKKKMMEDLIKAKERSEESDNLKSAFLNNLSHEIRTPFNGILGFLSILQDNQVSEEDRKEYFGMIDKSADRLMNTINDIVEISQIQTGQIKLNLTEVNLKMLGGELSGVFKLPAEEQGLLFSFQEDLNGDSNILYTDRLKVKTILSNLIRNALKFTKSGSIKVGIQKNPDFVEFTVEDTGIGIPEEKQATIFERFIQADLSSTRKFEGSGLGLSISKAYAEMLGGRIWVKSEVGKGSLFGLAIPHKTNFDGIKGARIKMSDDITRKNVGGLKILIAEDDEQSALLIEITVRIFGNDIIKVGSGLEAVEMCRKDHDIDLVLMDIKMPGMDGYEAVREIRQFNPRVIIIAQTAYALIGDREKAIEAGCDDYIPKPIRKEQLVELVRKYFKN